MKVPPARAVMFVGEQPGDQEDLAGRPFVGPAGQVFGRALKEVGIDRQTVYVTNAVKHFKFEPRGTRRIHSKPSSREVAACQPWLKAEIQSLRPRWIVCLGIRRPNRFWVPHFELPKIEERSSATAAMHHSFSRRSIRRPSSELRIPRCGSRRTRDS